MPKKLSRDMPTITSVTRDRTRMLKRITGLGPNRLSARPPIQVNTAALIAPMIPKTPMLVIDQFRTSVA